MPRAGVVPALVLALALLVPAAVPAALQTQVTARDQQLQALLDRRAESVVARDRDAFLGTVDPGAGPFAAAQAAWFDGVGRLPLGSYSLTLALARFGEFTRERDRRRYGPEAVVAAVEERLAIAGFDERPALGKVYYTFARRGEAWTIASDSDRENLGILSDRHPWEFGPVDVAASPHFLLVFHPADAGRVPILVPESRVEVERLLGSTLDVSNFVAFAL